MVRGSCIVSESDSQRQELKTNIMEVMTDSYVGKWFC